MTVDDATEPSDADQELLTTVHDELRRLARSHLRREREDHTLQATALVHEAWLAVRGRIPTSAPRRFYTAATEAMRTILIDHARRRGAQKRMGGLRKLPLDAVELARTGSYEEVVAVDDAVRTLAAENPRAAEIVRLRFFAGLEEAEAADVLRISPRTARREWAFARAFLWRILREHDGPAD